MKFFKPLLYKKWFDTGFGLLNYFKYPLVIFGFAEITLLKSYHTILILGILYTLSCFLLGWGWLKFGFFETETEINNMYNPFVHEMRKTYGSHRIKRRYRQ